MDPISKVSSRKGASGMAQMVEYLLASVRTCVLTPVLPLQKLILVLKAQPFLCPAYCLSTLWQRSQDACDFLPH
jgi:hypothetical protein